jgi:biotin carboxyl carrier protein
MHSKVVQQKSNGQMFDAVVDGDVAVVDGQVSRVTAYHLGSVYHVRIGNREVPVKAECDGINAVRLWINGYAYEFDVHSRRHGDLLEVLKSSPAAQTRTIRVASPMPGLLKAVHVKNGDTVRKGDVLFTLEAMKMENAIKAPVSGAVANCERTAGGPVEKGALLCMIEPNAL